MSHEIETHVTEDGTVLAAAAFARQAAWHQLGHVSSEPMTGDELLTNGRLGGWDIQKTAQYNADPDHEGLYLPAPNRFGLSRVNPFTDTRESYDASVGGGYKAFQNEQLVDFANLLVHESAGSAHFETGGSLAKGSRVFISVKIGQSMLVGGEDPVDLYLTLMDDKTGHGATIALISTVRVVCANTWRMALGNHVTMMKIWHTTNAQRNIEQARRSLQLTVKASDEFQAEADKLIETGMTESAFVKLTRKIWTAPKTTDSKRAATLHREREQTLVKLFLDSPTAVTPTGRTITKTRWGALQAVTEYTSQLSPVPSTKANPEAVRAERVALGAFDKITDRAFALLTV